MVREIKNKQLRRELAARGLSYVQLFKDCTLGYFYFTANNGNQYWSDSFCIFSFSECTPAEWADMIADRIKHNFLY